jgi:membrane associated rhomboid family serine protease
VLPLRDHLPTRTFPFVNYLLIAANVAVFVWERVQIASGVSPQRVLLAMGYIPAELWTDPGSAVVSVFTSMFTHDPSNLLHIGGNMLYLWIFGDNVEDAMGHFRYLAFYLVGGVAAAAAMTIIDPMSTVPMVGASGAISAVLAAYVFLYPRSPITVLNPIFLLWFFFGLFLTFPAWLVIGLFFLYNLVDALSAQAQGGVAYMAHVGGFVFGALIFRAFLVGRPRLESYDRWQQWGQRRRPRQRRDDLF